ncbi:MAG: phosphate ABC transporter ATP-binding protein [Candidatus Firestonebacteria bacterium RIFOXYC2_FULL_39_67]|nr:MAG: phosphate ABC transporter ATP-binding protein [Candidatus Firestonebacteria bacterium RIFOXYD2_FULL_39_29]OGF55557.1 MAG: phosphate ABC transporter ATP-binding protein [Candidatus Firestonebacteria bacterium RIFOXYC2_FULL_39_67]
MSIVEIRNLDLFYGSFHAIKGVNMNIEPNKITSMIGPSGCGKSTLLRCLNRMNDDIEGVKITGEILIEKANILRKTEDLDIDALRRKVGMVFQRPNPFPLTVFENVAFGLRIHKMAKGNELSGVVEESLKAVMLWDDLKDKLENNALNLSLEQRQRLCVARLIAVRPDIILLDEPCSALDPIATTRIEELMIELKKKYTIVIVTHNMQQAARVSDDTGFMLLGDLVEFGKTSQIFTAPKLKKTEDYITGRFG